MHHHAQLSYICHEYYSLPTSGCIGNHSNIISVQFHAKMLIKAAVSNKDLNARAQLWGLLPISFLCPFLCSMTRLFLFSPPTTLPSYFCFMACLHGVTFWPRLLSSHYSTCILGKKKVTVHSSGGSSLGKYQLLLFLKNFCG